MNKMATATKMLSYLTILLTSLSAAAPAAAAASAAPAAAANSTTSNSKWRVFPSRRVPFRARLLSHGHWKSISAKLEIARRNSSSSSSSSSSSPTSSPKPIPIPTRIFLLHPPQNCYLVSCKFAVAVAFLVGTLLFPAILYWYSFFCVSRNSPHYASLTRPSYDGWYRRLKPGEMTARLCRYAFFFSNCLVGGVSSAITWFLCKYFCQEINDGAVDDLKRFLGAVFGDEIKGLELEGLNKL